MQNDLKSLSNRNQRRSASPRTRPGQVFAAICGLALVCALMGAAAEAADNIAAPNSIVEAAG